MFIYYRKLGRNCIFESASRRGCEELVQVSDGSCRPSHTDTKLNTCGNDTAMRGARRWYKCGAFIVLHIIWLYPQPPPSMTTPNASPEGHISKRQRAKSFVKRIGRKSSQLFKRHHHSDRSPSPHRRQSSTISVLVVDTTRSVLALSGAPSIGRGGKSEHSRTSSAETTGSSGGSGSVLEWPSAMEQGHWLGIPGTASGEEVEQGSHEPEIAVDPSLAHPPPMSSESSSGEHSSTAVSQLPLIVEPEGPDPFHIGDSEDDTSEEDDPAKVSASQPSLATSSTAAEEISLAQPHSTPTSALPSPTPTSTNPLPPLPPPHKTPSSPDSEDSDDDPPELYNTALTNPTMFLPIPNVRPLLFNPLTWWLSRSLINYSCIIRQIR